MKTNYCGSLFPHLPFLPDLSVLCRVVRPLVQAVRTGQIYTNSNIGVIGRLCIITGALSFLKGYYSFRGLVGIRTDQFTPLGTDKN